MKTKLFVLLIMAVFGSEKYENAQNGPNSGETEGEIFVKIEESEYGKKKVYSEYIGVTSQNSKWHVQRWSRNEKKKVSNGYYDNEETAAHASDTLARKLMEKGEQGHKLNFPDDDTEVHPAEKKNTSEYFGVCYTRSRWYASRWSKNEKKYVYYGYYDNEETAAHASDTLARKLTNKGKQDHKLNFPDDHIEVHPTERTAKTSKYLGVRYKHSKWYAIRWSKNEKKGIYYGYYDNEETAAHASDTLARKLMENGEQDHTLNFPDDDTEVHAEEKTPTSKYIGVTYSKRDAMWYVIRWSKNEKKGVHYGCYDNEETAAHASDTLARKLMENGEQDHKLNFPDDDTEVHPGEYRKKKRKRKENFQDN